MTNILKKKYIKIFFNKLDIKIASILEKKNNLLLLIFLLLSKCTRNGNVCLDIKKININFFLKNHKIKKDKKIEKLIKIKYKEKIKILKKSNAICNPKKLNKPLVLSKNKLYFQNLWKDEQTIICFFKKNLSYKVNEKKLKKILNEIFEFEEKKNWQKIAVTIAATSKISIISGGPGTGKTTIITKILLTLIKLNKKKIKIKIGAPTGKSVEKITHSINEELKKITIKKSDQKKIPKKAYTIHRLLKFQPEKGTFYYNKKNQLTIDFLILDETSMIGLSIMARLIESLPKHTVVIFLGDKNQLPSIESGFIFNNLCYFSKFPYTKKRIKQIKKITGYKIKQKKIKHNIKIQDNICMLTKNYRFHHKSEIGILSSAIKNNNIKKIKKILKNKNKNIFFKNIDKIDDLNNIIKTISKKYKKYLKKIKNNKNKKKIINHFNKYRILTAKKKTNFGTKKINHIIEKMLHEQRYIKKKNKSSEDYEGRPIMITENNYNLSLFNGETGIILKEKCKLKAFFYKPNNLIKQINILCLPEYETAYAITVHKSQGSEFDEICLILPPIFDSNIKKELIYTAVTRAKKKITIYANINNFIKTIKNPTKRCSDLIDQLSSK